MLHISRTGKTIQPLKNRFAKSDHFCFFICFPVVGLQQRNISLLRDRECDSIFDNKRTLFHGRFVADNAPDCNALLITSKDQELLQDVQNQSGG